MFHHGWPLSADDWDGQMLFFLGKGYRVIAHDRRGHGRSSQAADGNDMDTYAADVAALVAHLDLRDAIHVGHSTGGGEVARYVARHGKEKVAKAGPDRRRAAGHGEVAGQSRRHCRSMCSMACAPALAANRAEFYWTFPIPFYGYNREGVRLNEARPAIGGARP